MNKTVLKFSLFCLALVAMSSVALAQPANQLGNPGFESPAFGKETNFSLVFPWQDDGIDYVNSGIEDTGAHSGTYRAFEMSGDDGAYQISNYQMQNGDQITLSWWALATVSVATNPPEQVVGLLRAGTTSDAFNICTPLPGVTSNGLPGSWTQYTMNYTAGIADFGKYVGCYFNTTNAFGFATNSFAGYDDFYLAVLPAGSLPSIVTSPASQTAYTGGSVTFTVSAVGATSYQWMKGVTGSGIYTNLLNGGIVSGVATTTLTITNLTSTNNGDYVVVVSNGSGSVTSAPPANLTVSTIIYQETFSMPKSNDQNISNVGWINDIGGSYGPQRIFSNNNGVTYGVNKVCAVYSYPNVTNTANEAFYFTTASANGGPYDLPPGDGLGPVTNKMAFPGINLSVVANLSFTVAANNGSANSPVSWVVQLNNNSWYVSTNTFTEIGLTFQTFTMNFNPSASGWNQLRVSGTGSFSFSNTNVVIGAVAPANLSGYITGGGLLVQHLPAGLANLQFNNYAILGAIPPSVLPVINSPPVTRTNNTGTAATFTVSATTNGVTTGLTYKWMSGAVGSGIYTPLSGGQYFGVTSPSLTISNVANPGNHQDYVVVVTDGAGSVTSTPPATLWIVHSAPILTADTFLYPDNATDLGSASGLSIHAGNNNVMHLTSAFIGDLPISYQWQYSIANDGSMPVVPVSNATNSTLTFSNPQTNSSGYYRLSASNSQGGPTNSDWVALTIFPASTAQVQWAAKVPFNALTAAQILGGTRGTFFEAESFGGPALSVTNGNQVFIFDNTGVSATLVGGYTPRGSGQFIGETGDTNLDSIFGADTESGSGSTITLNYLTVGSLYSAQLFAFNDVAASGRQGNFATTNDAADVSQSFAMGDNVYVVGTFTATNTTETITLNGDAGCYMSAAIVRNVPPSPTISVQKIGSSLQVTYANGILLQSANVKGPWTTNNVASPYMFTPTGPSMFFRVQSP